MELMVLMTFAIGMVVYWDYQFRVLGGSAIITGDSWHMRRMVGTTEVVSAPYAWRRMYPWVARVLGLRATNYVSVVMGTYLSYWAAGGGANGIALGLFWLISPFFARFYVRSWDYGDGFNICVGIATCALVRMDSPWMWLMAPIAAFSRENLVVLVVAVALANQQYWLAALTVAAGGLCYLMRREADVRFVKHPLNELTKRSTYDRWIKTKGDGAIDYAHTFHVFSPIVFGLPFVWGDLANADRTAFLLAIIPVWFLSLPASGQSRAFSFMWCVLLPIFGGYESRWLWFLVLGGLWWPCIKYQLFDESGGQIHIDTVEGGAEMVASNTASAPMVLPLPPPGTGQKLEGSESGGSATMPLRGDSLGVHVAKSVGMGSVQVGEGANIGKVEHGSTGYVEDGISQATGEGGDIK